MTKRRTFHDVLRKGSKVLVWSDRKKGVVSSIDKINNQLYNVVFNDSSDDWIERSNLRLIRRKGGK